MRPGSTGRCCVRSPDPLGQTAQMASVDVDVVVVGLGPGGEDLAGRLATAGLTVVGVERHLTGGECPYYACIPTKMMVRAADALLSVQSAP